jgi:glycosyltransferase involved in cell wall biosynthesis
MTKKIKLLFQSDFSLAKTGFARNARAILSHLYRTGKYEIVHYCCGVNYSNPQLGATPWKSIGCLPDSQLEVEMLQKDPNVAKLASYGAHYLDRVIKEEKPDVYIAVQDIWGVEFAVERPWFDKINSVIWTTLDSLPILPSAMKAAKKIKNYWIWSDFATKELNDAGHKHVITQHGALEDSAFYKLSDDERKKLRQKFHIPEDTFVIGFVFRNQLRKSVPNLLQGFKIFKDRNPKTKTKLFFHTHFGEGWNILRLAKEHGVAPADILCTYACRQCSAYEIKSFQGQDQQCSNCGKKDGQVTAQVGCGVTEAQLNEVYNLMDVYCHPFTSGGQEIPIQEAKLTELITLVTNYSCGEDMCVKEAASLPLEWSEYREAGTEFIKASTSPKSIAKNLKRVLSMRGQDLEKMGKQARKWTIENYSVKSLGKQIENFLDSCEKTNYDFSEKGNQKKPEAQIPDTPDDEKWLAILYKNILVMDVDDDDEGLKYWMQEIKKGIPRKSIEEYFRQVASKENAENTQVSLNDFVDDTGNKRVLLVLKESIGDIVLASSLFEDIKSRYPDHDIYIATDPAYFELLQPNPFIHKVIPYSPIMESELNVISNRDEERPFDVYCNLPIMTQKVLNYLSNDNPSIELVNK